jgi:hypothetical protein
MTLRRTFRCPSFACWIHPFQCSLFHIAPTLLTQRLLFACHTVPTTIDDALAGYTPLRVIQSHYTTTTDRDEGERQTIDAI